MAELKGERLTPWRWDARAVDWLSELRGGDESRRGAELSLLTWNVWFQPDHYQARMRALLDELRAREADVVCLQEALPPLAQALAASTWVRERYAMSDTTGATLVPYGVLLLSRHEVRSLRLVTLRSKMSRRLLIAKLSVAGHPLAVATVHLESRRPNDGYRREQLRTAMAELRATAQDALLCGDFNFCSTWAENDVIERDFTDLWPSLRGGDLGWTEDTARNPMLRESKGKEKQVRYDRVLLRSPASTWRGDSIELVGTTPFSTVNPDLRPSDHFGLHARVTTIR